MIILYLMEKYKTLRDVYGLDLKALPGVEGNIILLGDKNRYLVDN